MPRNLTESWCLILSCIYLGSLRSSAWFYLSPTYIIIIIKSLSATSEALLLLLPMPKRRIITERGPSESGGAGGWV